MEQEVVYLRKGMGTFIQGEKSFKPMIKSINVPLVKERVGLNFNKNDKVIKYDGRCGIPYKYVVPWKTCNKYGRKGHLSQNFRLQNDQNRKKLTKMKPKGK